MGDERYLSAFLSLLLLAGCTDVFDNAESWDYFDEHATSGAEDDVETTGDGSTSASTTDASGETTGASPSLPGEYGGFAPEILSLSVSPDMVEGAGSALVFLEHTANAGQLSVVAEAELRGEVQSITLFDGDAASVSWPVEFAITSAEAFNGAWTVRARVENGYGADEAAVDLAVDLPPGGQEAWSRVVEAQSGFHFATAIAAHPAGAAVAVRIDKIGEVLGIVRLHAGETGEIAWESEPLGEFDPAGIAALGDGQIVVAGTDLGLARARTFTFAPEEGTAPVDTWTAGTGHNEARALAHAE